MSRIQKNAVTFFADLRGATFVSLVTRTKARCRKPFQNVEKVSRVVVLFNFDYDKGVYRRLDKEGKDEGDFRPGESWHVPVIDEEGRYTPFCRHKDTGDIYFRCQWIGTVGEPIYTDAWGKTYTKEQLADFLPSRSNYENQGLDKPLVFLTYKVASILEASANGKKEVFV